VSLKIECRYFREILVNSNSHAKRQAYSFVIALWTFFNCYVEAAQDKYVIAVNEAYYFNLGASNVRALFNKIYAPLGIKPQIEFYPSLRGLKLVNEGLLDAEAGRSLNVGKQYTNLIKVSYPIMQHHNGFFCLTIEACKTSATTRYAVVTGFEAGKKYCENNNLNCLTEQSHGLLAKALEFGAIDVLIASLNTATKALCKMKTKTVYYKDSMALNVTSYHLIHNKHQDLEPALAASIQNLAKSGEIKQFLQNASIVNSNCLVDVIELP
jgi:polar amino acid transport system substrate-binding protein